MDVQSLLHLILRRKWFVLRTAVAAGIGAYLIGLLMVNYEAEGQVIIRPVGAESLKAPESPTLGLVSSPYIDNVRQEGLSYISILRSRDSVGRVVDQLNLQKEFEGGGKGIGHTIKQPLRFLFYGRLPSVEQTAREIAIERTRKSARAILISGSSVIQISVTHKDAKKAADIVNELIDTAVARSAERNAQSSEEAVEFMEVELKSIHDRTGSSIARLEELRESHGIKSTGTVATQIKDLGERIKKLEIGMDEQFSALVLAQKKASDLEARIGELPEHLRFSYTMSRNPELETLRQMLLTQELNLVAARIDFKTESAPLTALKERVAIAQKALDEQLGQVMLDESFQADTNRQQIVLDLIRAQVEVATIPQVVEELNRRIKDYNGQVVNLAAISEEFADLEKEIAALHLTDAKVRAALNVTRMIARRNLTEFEVLNRAVTPKYPSIKDIPLAFYVVASTMIGAFLAVFFLFYRQGKEDGKKAPKASKKSTS
ncbi:MAG: hypothetical protein ACI8UO_005229 [Verrucomicrobiales bacterium]|jgi:uncharacterized protein involved in exopolysaccharide biosynthesis